jgi:hypothetical protein
VTRGGGDLPPCAARDAAGSDGGAEGGVTRIRPRYSRAFEHAAWLERMRNQIGVTQVLTGSLGREPRQTEPPSMQPALRIPRMIVTSQASHIL